MVRQHRDLEVLHRQAQIPRGPNAEENLLIELHGASTGAQRDLAGLCISHLKPSLLSDKGNVCSVLRLNREKAVALLLRGPQITLRVSSALHEFWSSDLHKCRLPHTTPHPHS